MPIDKPFGWVRRAASLKLSIMLNSDAVTAQRILENSRYPFAPAVLCKLRHVNVIN